MFKAWGSSGGTCLGTWRLRGLRAAKVELREARRGKERLRWGPKRS